MDNKECEFKPECFYADNDCKIINNDCGYRQRLIKLLQLSNQYTAVLAQNKSLQGELRLYKLMLEKAIMVFAIDNPRYNLIFDKIKQQALQELEAEND